MAIALADGAMVPVGNDLPPAGSVTLSEQKGVVESHGSESILRFSARVSNTLPVALRAIRVGFLLASDEETLQKLDATALYRHDGPQLAANVGVVNERVVLAVPAKSERQLELTVHLAGNGSDPHAFVTHVLGYELADLSTRMLFDLLATQAASDEVAAVQAFGLSGGSDERLQARRRWLARTPELMPGLVAELDRVVPDRPSESEAFRRVFAARAAGVLGGDAAERALRRALRDPGLARFDEPLQVLRIARVLGSSLETPLAFALPAEARRMNDVVAAALVDCLGLDNGVPNARD